MSINLLEEEDEPVSGAEEDELLDELGDIGCLFPCNCLMPGVHYTGECHTAEMLEDYYQECQERSL